MQYGNGNPQQNGFSKGGGNGQGAPSFNDSYSAVSILGLVFSDAQRTGSLKSQTISKAGIIISAVILGLIAFFIIFWIIAMFAWIV